MMKRKNDCLVRFSGVLLALLMLLSIFAGCKKQPDGNDGTASTEPPASNTVTEEPAKQELTAKEILGEKDLGGETVTFFVRSGGNMWDIESLYATEYLSDTINDAVFTRNSTLQTQYNFEIKEIESGATSYSQRVQNQILGGENGFDVLTACGYDMAELAAGGVLRDMSWVDGISLDKSWWNTTLNSQLTVKNALYYFSGDIICEDNMAARVIFFNKQIANSIGVFPEELYQKAASGSWTMADLFEIASRAYLDLDDEHSTSKGDRLGLIGQEVIIGYVFLTAAGVNLTQKNGQDEMTFTGAFNYDVLDRVASYLASDESVFITEDALTPYKNNRVLFMTEVLGTIKKIRDWDIKSGILPLPKLDAQQQSYNHFADGNCLNLLAIPTGNTHRLSKIVFAMDAMCIESTSTLNPAFYDTCLRGRYSYDEESSAMLDIILDSLFIENSNLYKRAWKGTNGNDLQSDIVDAIASGNSVSTVITSWKNNLPGMIETTVNKLYSISQAQRPRN